MWIDRARVGRYARAGWRWVRLLAPKRARPGVRVFYGQDSIPGPGAPVAGGTAKFQRLATNHVDGPTLASMAVSGASIFIRSQSHLYRLGR